MSDSDRSLLPALDRLRTRWRVIAIACSVSVSLALVVSLLLPKQYTATTRIVIEPPAGNDPRAATAVSPIYLESLRSYELFASSDSLFQQAVQRFGLRQGSEPIDKLKKKVLKAELPKNLKILEIQATLPDPKTAYALALYIAEETVKLNRAATGDADQELVAEAEKQSAAARDRFRSADAEWSRALGDAPVETLKAEVTGDEALRATLQRELAESVVIADPERAEGYRKQLETLLPGIAAKRKLLAERSARLDRLESERKAAQSAFTASETRAQEVRSARGYRGERLRIIDPGVVPERPSFPNTPLNLVIALLVALAISVLYLILEMSYTEQRAESNRRPCWRPSRGNGVSTGRAFPKRCANFRNERRGGQGAVIRCRAHRAVSRRSGSCGNEREVALIGLVRLESSEQRRRETEFRREGRSQSAALTLGTRGEMAAPGRGLRSICRGGSLGAP
jgi:uncharacterized protein involved in exopolysaccharide biosynthesis